MCDLKIGNTGKRVIRVSTVICPYIMIILILLLLTIRVTTPRLCDFKSCDLTSFFSLSFKLIVFVLVEQGALHIALVAAIRPHVPALRTSPYGKKVLSCSSLKK